VCPIALSKFLLLARNAGRGARMLEVCPHGCPDGAHPHSGSLERAHYPLATLRMPLPTLVKILGGIPFQYQNKVERSYGLLPCPPQTPAASFKRLYRK
jgi:hypothetical protein